MASKELENLRLIRKPIRCSFTKIADQLQKKLENAETDHKSLKELMTKLTSRWDKLVNLYKEILNSIVESTVEEKEQMCDKEYLSVESYEDTFIEMRMKVDEVTEQTDMKSNSELTLMSDNCSVINNSCKRNLRLPKLELKKFSGNLKDWIQFWGQFQKIDSDQDIDETDKFQYLLQATEPGSSARKIVESFPPLSKDYSQALQCLKDRFGREDMQTELYIRELLRLVLASNIGRQKQNLANLYDKLETYLRSLETLGVAKNKYAAMLYPLIESCLPEEVMKIWERNVSMILNDTPVAEWYDSKLQSLMKFLRAEVEGEQCILMTKDGFGLVSKAKGIKSPAPRRNLATASDLFTGNYKEAYKIKCCFCSEPHKAQDCKRTLDLSLAEKQRILKEKSCCYLCFKPRHKAKFCRTRMTCPKCHKRHFLLMCEEREHGRDTQTHERIKEEGRSKEKATEEFNVITNRTCSSEVLLQTIPVILYNGEKKLTIRALYDSGSQQSYVSKRIAITMGYSSINRENVLHNLFGRKQIQSVHNRYKINVSDVNKTYFGCFEALDQNMICANIPRFDSKIYGKEIEDLGITINDCIELTPEVSDPIHLLIGADVAGRLMTGKAEQLSCGLTAIETRLGWTLTGRLKQFRQNKHDRNVNTILSLHIMDCPLSKLWSLDALGIKDPIEKHTKDYLQEQAKELFTKTIEQKESGRYIVALPWIQGHPQLVNNRKLAELRLESTIKKLKISNSLQLYDEIFREWEKEDIIELVPQDQLLKRSCYYLPHHPVFKEQSSTKIRPVFDGSSRQRNSVSINDCLAKGPNLIELIPSVLNRFRYRRIGVTSDIKRAFLKIELRERDRDYLRFIWLQDLNHADTKIYRHKRVVLGICSSPFLLEATIAYHLDSVPYELRHTASILKKTMYVDNCVHSVGSKAELEVFIHESKRIMSSGQFDLRGWRYSADVNEEADSEQLSEEINLLGLVWNIAEDTLRCDPKEDKDEKEETITKRVVLSLVNKIFDPIGFLSPFTLTLKIIMQTCWKLQLNWDTPLPAHISTKVIAWKRSLNKLKELRIPRYLLTYPEGKLSIHTFCDTSAKAYATYIFIRNEMTEGISSQLVSARAKVTPLKKASISRLELTACTIGARLADTIKRDLSLQHIETFFWTDSTNALYWIINDEPWATFVFNRVVEIRKLTETNSWRHIAGRLNPADLPARTGSLSKLIEKRCWEGPTWLKEKQEYWPHCEIIPDRFIVESEKRKAVITTINCTDNEEPCYIKISSHIKVVDILIVGNDDTKHINWPLARVVETLPDKDGLTRLVKLYTNSKEILRSIQRLYHLELNEEPEEILKSKVISEIKDKRQSGKETGSAILKDDLSRLNPNNMRPPYRTKKGRVIQIPERYQVPCK